MSVSRKLDSLSEIVKFSSPPSKILSKLADGMRSIKKDITAREAKMDKTLTMAYLNISKHSSPAVVIGDILSNMEATVRSINVSKMSQDSKGMDKARRKLSDQTTVAALYADGLSNLAGEIDKVITKLRGDIWDEVDKIKKEF